MYFAALKNTLDIYFFYLWQDYRTIRILCYDSLFLFTLHTLMSYLVNILTFDATPPRAQATSGGHSGTRVCVNKSPAFTYA